jgi:hypothetical protein
MLQDIVSILTVLTLAIWSNGLGGERGGLFFVQVNRQIALQIKQTTEPTLCIVVRSMNIVQLPTLETSR